MKNYFCFSKSCFRIVDVYGKEVKFCSDCLKKNLLKKNFKTTITLGDFPINEKLKNSIVFSNPNFSEIKKSMIFHEIYIHIDTVDPELLKVNFIFLHEFLQKPFLSNLKVYYIGVLSKLEKNTENMICHFPFEQIDEEYFVEDVIFKKVRYNKGGNLQDHAIHCRLAFLDNEHNIIKIEEYS